MSSVAYSYRPKKVNIFTKTQKFGRLMFVLLKMLCNCTKRRKQLNCDGLVD